MNSILELINKITTDKPEQYYKKVHQKLELSEKSFIVTANPEIIMLGRSMDEMRKALDNSEIIPDGIGVVKALNMIGKPCVRNAGIDLVYDLLDYSNAHKLSVFIYGAKEEVLNDLKKECMAKWSRITFTGLYNGYTYKPEQIKETIKQTPSDIYLIALGTPTQELFINSIYPTINQGVCIGIGGSLDVISGHIQRAPDFFLKHNLEWLYRITTEPKRLKRFWHGNIVFVFVLYKELLLSKRGKND